jgi:cobalt/nickel transport system permease protein
MAEVPHWMRPCADGSAAIPPGRAVRTSFARKALKQMGRMTVRALRPGVLENGDGFLQRIDPRAKVVATVGLIVICTLLRRPESLASCMVVAFAAAVLSRFPMRAYTGSLILASGLAVAVALPASLSVITPGNALLTFWHPGELWRTTFRFPTDLSVTGEGLFVASRLALRTVACASLGLLLAFSTKAGQLFQALRSLGVPRSFVMILGMSDRYASVLGRTARELHLAKLSRTITARAIGQEQRWVAGGMGALFRKSRRLSDAVVLAMTSRGYTGEARALRPARMDVGDWLFLSAASALAAGLLAMG